MEKTMRKKVYKTKPVSLDVWEKLNFSQKKISGFDLKSYQDANVLLVGGGAIGSHVARGMARKGIGNLDIFDDSADASGVRKYANLELTFGEGEQVTMFVSHHDVNNPRSQNCQDNSASVSNLLALAEHLTENTPDHKVMIVFTDCEEFGGEGAKRLSDRINENTFGEVKYIVNLELTANGRNFWHDGAMITESILMDALEENKEFYRARTPFNDSVVFRNNGIDSICVGTLNDDNMNQVRERNYCKTWAVCHKDHDTIDQAITEDMDNFVEFLITLI